jgi:hypothetical protein
MGALIDRLAQTIEGLRRVQSRLIKAGKDTEVVALQTNLIDPLQSLSLDLDGSPVDQKANEIEAAYVEARGKRQKRGKAKAVRMSWSCCHEPHATVTRKGNKIWVADCKWKKGDRTGQVPRRIAEGDSPKPQRFKLGGRIMKRC